MQDRNESLNGLAKQRVRILKRDRHLKVDVPCSRCGTTICILLLLAGPTDK